MLSIEAVKDLYKVSLKEYAEEFIKNGYVGARYRLGRIHAYGTVLEYRFADVEKDIENSVAPEDAEPVEADATPEAVSI